MAGGKEHWQTDQTSIVVQRLGDGERDSSPSAQETPAVRVQPDRRAKMKEPSFRYMA
ncbi:unnamed protein product [Spirodela intermedia]|uniref:Uncharacterized protein n=1 Tax=Spirodela intermedia TaxID=51605 RepID=A0A7I8JR59_SPIIN|nr:unnamed protein product [Spirodela intermedia]CAA6672650.1 unnamed protein product [Spirodela intermedia]